jgi:hypothetical protein
VLKDIIHTIASVSLVVWLVGYFGYGMTGLFHMFLLTAVIAALVRYLIEPRLKRKAKH